MPPVTDDGNSLFFPPQGTRTRQAVGDSGNSDNSRNLLVPIPSPTTRIASPHQPAAATQRSALSTPTPSFDSSAAAGMSFSLPSGLLDPTHTSEDQSHV